MKLRLDECCTKFPACNWFKCASEFNGANGQPLPMEMYEAVNPISDAVVVILEGFPDAGFEKHVGCRFMDMEWTIRWRGSSPRRA